MAQNETNQRAVGKPFQRVEGRLKVTGAARYSAEFPLPDLAHAVVVQSTAAGGRIVKLDTSAAEKSRGVLLVLTHKNTPRLKPNPHAALGVPVQPGSAAQTHVPMQDDKIVHCGQHIALVVAETLEQAQFAASLVKVEYAPETVLTRLEIEKRILPASGKIANVPCDISRGDVKAGFDEAAATVEETYTQPFQHHNPLEVHATIAIWTNDNLTLYEPSQWVNGVQQGVATMLGIPSEKVRVISRFMGAGFGNKCFLWAHTVFTAVAARELKRPVKLVLSRKQLYSSVGHRPPTVHQMKLGARIDGTLNAIQTTVTTQTTPFDGDDALVPGATLVSRMYYKCPNVSTSHRIVRTNVPASTIMRGPAQYPGMFALESALDELAYKLKIDPLELRLKNYAATDPETGHPFSSKALRECYKLAGEKFGWNKRNPQPRSMRDGRYLHGFGMASTTYYGKSLAANASARIFADGTCAAYSATHDLGTGTLTVMAQIAADAVGLPFERVRFELGDTDLPPAPLTGISITAGSVGSAVHNACESVRRKAIQLAIADQGSPLFGQKESDVTVSGGRMFSKIDESCSETYQELLKRNRLDFLEAKDAFKPGKEVSEYSMYTFGAQFAEVRIDTDSGEIRVPRFVGAYAAGRILNPKTAASQLSGGIIMGIGNALTEETVMDNRSGHFVNHDLSTYHVPVHADVGGIEAYFVEEDEKIVNPLGVKGCGEVSLVGVAPALANAVFHATGKRVRNLPLTADKLL